MGASRARTEPREPEGRRERGKGRAFQPDAPDRGRAAPELSRLTLAGAPLRLHTPRLPQLPPVCRPHAASAPPGRLRLRLRLRGEPVEPSGAHARPPRALTPTLALPWLALCAHSRPAHLAPRPRPPGLCVSPEPPAVGAPSRGGRWRAKGAAPAAVSAPPARRAGVCLLQLPGILLAGVSAPGNLGSGACIGMLALLSTLPQRALLLLSPQLPHPQRGSRLLSPPLQLAQQEGGNGGAARPSWGSCQGQKLGATQGSSTCGCGGEGQKAGNKAAPLPMRAGVLHPAPWGDLVPRRA